MQAFGSSLRTVAAMGDASAMQSKAFHGSPTKAGSRTPVSQASTAPNTPFGASQLTTFGMVADTCPHEMNDRDRFVLCNVNPAIEKCNPWKEHVGDIRAMRIAHTAYFDADGVLHGVCQHSQTFDMAGCLKLLRLKKLSRRHLSGIEKFMLMVDPVGRAIIFIQTGLVRSRHLLRRRVCPKGVSIFRCDTASVDHNGVVHWNCAADNCGEVDDHADNNVVAALTPCGVAVDLGGSNTISFSAASHGGRTEKEQAKALRAMRSRRAAREADLQIQAEEVCCLDETGVVHGSIPVCQSYDNATRLKLLRQKKLSRRSRSHMEELVFTVTPDGRVVLFLRVASDARKRRSRHLPCSRTPIKFSDDAAAVDGSGIVHWVRDLDQIC